MKKRFLQWLINKLTVIHDKLYLKVNVQASFIDECLTLIESLDHDNPHNYEQLLNSYRVLIEEYSGSRDIAKLYYFYIYRQSYKHLIEKYNFDSDVKKELMAKLVIKPLPPIMGYSHELNQEVELIHRPVVREKVEIDPNRIKSLESYDLNQARIDPKLRAEILENYPNTKIQAIRFDPPTRVRIDIDRGDLVEKFSATYFDEEQIGKVFEILDAVRK